MIFATIDLDYRFSLELFMRDDGCCSDWYFIEGLVIDKVAITSSEYYVTLDLEFGEVLRSLDQFEGTHGLFLVEEEEGDGVDLISNDGDWVSEAADDALDFAFGVDGVSVGEEVVVEVEPGDLLAFAAVHDASRWHSDMLIFLREGLDIPCSFVQNILSLD